jgi:integrase
LWLRPATRDSSGSIVENARWIIKDSGRQVRTGCGASDREEAERKLAEYIASKYAPERRERPLSEIRISDVIKIYLDDVAPGHARPEKTAERAERLLEYFGDKRLDEITGAVCRAYAVSRQGKTSDKRKGGNAGGDGGAKRDLEDLRAAITHHQKEGYHRAVVRVVLPERGAARQRWLTRDEAAKLLWTCWRTREVQEGAKTDKRPLRHLCRFLILGLYTGSRPGAILNATWDRGPGRSHVDIESGVFHRQAEGKAETNKRQPTVKLSPRLKAHLSRWRRLDGKAAQIRDGERVIGSVVTFNGEPVQSVKVALGRAVTLAKLDAGVTAYTLRHSCASWLVAKGLPTRKVADFLGTSDQMIIEHYGHLAPDYQDEAALAIGRK